MTSKRHIDEWVCLFDERHVVKRAALGQGVLQPEKQLTMKVIIEIIRVMIIVPGSDHHDITWPLLDIWVRCVLSNASFRLHLWLWESQGPHCASTVTREGTMWPNAPWHRRSETCVAWLREPKKQMLWGGARFWPGRNFVKKSFNCPKASVSALYRDISRKIYIASFGNIAIFYRYFAMYEWPFLTLPVPENNCNSHSRYIWSLTTWD